MKEQLYSIRPLVWEKDKHDEHSYKAHSVLGVYDVWGMWGNGWHWSCRSANVFQDCDSSHAGKAAAESHYRERLLSALVAIGVKP